MDSLAKINTDYLVTLFFLLLTSNANFLSFSTPSWFIILFLMILAGVLKKKFEKKDMTKIFWFSTVYIVYMCFRFFVINELELEYLGSDMFFLIKYIALAFVLCAILKEETIAYFVRVVTHLAILSFAFFAFQLIAADAMYKLFTTISPDMGSLLPGYSNLFLFTYTRGFHDFSNSGFIWEPGAYGCFLVLTLMFHFFLTRFRLDGTAFILILASITTFSTTTYLGLFVLLMMAYRYRVPKINVWVIVLIPVVIGMFIFIPFLADKIIDTYKEDMRDLNHLKVLEKFYHHNRMQIPLNRFSSMWHIINSFGDKLILGVSNKYGELLNKAYTVNISNGIFDFFAKFGIVAFIYLSFCYLRFCRPYVLTAENLIYCFLILLALSFGEPVLFLPFVLTFLFMRIKQTPIASKSKDNNKNLYDSPSVAGA